MDYKNLEMLSWLVSQFRKAGETGITFDQLIDKLVDEPIGDGEQPDGDNSYPLKILSKRTFHNYLKELRDRFGIKIECDNRLQHEVGKKALSEENRRYRYRLVEEPKSDSTPWTMPYLMALETSSAMRNLQVEEGDKKYVYIDCKATGVENMNVVFDAIRQQKCIDFAYFLGRRGPYHEKSFVPRGLVMKNFVWYMLGHSVFRTPAIWPLSRVTEVKITDTVYRPDMGFSPERFWRAHKELWEEYFL